MHIVWPLVWFVLGAVAAFAWISMRLRMRRALDPGGPDLDDEDIRRIEQVGTLMTDDHPPLDLEHIRRSEDEFWDETWDQADEF